MTYRIFRTNRWGWRPRIWLTWRWLNATKREVAGAAQRDRAARDASGGPAGFRQFRRDRRVRRNPDRGAVVEMRDAGEIDQAVTAFARASNSGLIVTPAGSAVHRNLIITLAARHRLPTIYPYRYHAADGGLISYGPDSIEPYRRRPATSIASSGAACCFCRSRCFNPSPRSKKSRRRAQFSDGNRLYLAQCGCRRTRADLVERGWPGCVPAAHPRVHAPVVS
jgi:hypothetical protein